MPVPLAGSTAADQLERPEVWWETAVYRLPDDGTGAESAAVQALADAVRDREAAEAVVRWIHGEYDNEDCFGCIRDDIDKPAEELLVDASRVRLIAHGMVPGCLEAVWHAVTEGRQTLEWVTTSGALETVADADADQGVPESMDRLFESSGAARYRFERAPDACVCETIETLGSPVSDVRAEDGTLVVTLHVADVEEVKEIIDQLRTEYDDVSLRLLQQTGDSDQEDLVFVDRGSLTDRQREVLETAASMGYFEYPKGANASEVADALEISLSTFAEHLAAAQTKLLDDVLDV
jgi:predicted DNA binding protein